MRKDATVIFCSLLFMSTCLLAQNAVLQDPVSAKVFNSEKYSEINGSPFLYDKWIKGSVTTSKGTYNSLDLKFDAYNNVLFFKRDDQPFEFQEQVQSFTLMPVITDSSSYLIFKKGLAGNSLKPDQFVQVMVEGPVSLYRSDAKMVSDINQINAGVVKTFTNSVRYFIKKGDNIQLIRPGKKEILSILQDKEDKVQSFAKDNKLSFSKDADLISIIRYYNNLTQ